MRNAVIGTAHHPSGNGGDKRSERGNLELGLSAQDIRKLNFAFLPDHN